MKNSLIILLLFSSLNAFSQLEDLTGQFDVHAGYSLPLGQNYPINGGISIGAEPKFWYNEDLVFGAKLGFNFLSSPAAGVKLAPITTIALVGEKYMGGDGAATFFIGGSVGAYIGGQTRKIDGIPTGLKASKILGLAPRAGVQFGQYRLMAEYHMRKNLPKFVSIMLGYTFGSE